MGRVAQLRRAPIRVCMPHHIFVVSRHHPDLYDYLTNRFQHDGNVRVILDRRRGDRRQLQVTGPPPEGGRRWRLDRRTRLSVDEELRSRSHTIITLPD